MDFTTKFKKLGKDKKKDIATMSFKEIADKQPALLKCFLESTNNGDKSTAQQYFEIYEKLNGANPNAVCSSVNMEELADMGLPYDMENDLSNSERYKIVQDIQTELGKLIELQNDYKNFEKRVHRYKKTKVATLPNGFISNIKKSLHLAASSESMFTPPDCFDELDMLSRTEKNVLYFMNFKYTVSTYPAADILSSYLHRRGGNAVIGTLLDIYNQCIDYDKADINNIGQRELDELTLLCIPFNFDNVFKKYSHVPDILNALENIIVQSKEYKEYKSFVLARIFNKDAL